MDKDFTKQTKELIDELKKVCADFGLGNDGNESKIITQAFLYKFMNDKLGFELKKIEKNKSDQSKNLVDGRSSNVGEAIKSITEEEKQKLFKSILHVAYSNFIENMESNKIKVNKDIKKRIRDLNIKVMTPYKFNVYGRDDYDLKGNKLTVEDIGGRTCYYVKSLQN
mgnify:CR=1 FL=1